jgi:ribosomal protein L40E
VEYKRPAFDRGAILGGLASRPEDPQWLVWSVSRFGGVGPDPERFLDAALGRLVAAGQLVREDDRYALAPDGAQLAERLLLLTSILSVRAGRLVPPDTYHQLQVVCLQAGLHDILSIEAVDGRLRFDSLASVEVMEYLRYLLQTPDALRAADAAAGITCRSCGTAMPASAKFCKKCGTPLTPASASSVCSRCGAAVSPGAKFCRACGAKIV